MKTALICFFFFFQAEDGIRDHCVTGVQTCALPIWIGRSAVEKKLAACANIVAGVDSIYRWKGKVERAREVLVVMKTTAGRLRELEREVKRMHSYDVPEFIVLPIVAGGRGYFKMVDEEEPQRICAC